MAILVGQPGSKTELGLRLVQMAAFISAAYIMAMSSDYRQFQDFLFLCFAALGSAAWILVHIGVDIYAMATSRQLSSWTYFFHLDLVNGLPSRSTSS